ncbi:MAG TPA: mandelate racemase/muconate lactonizing enzyme family protein [Chloroflexota bacterium]|nr:mandelate racemase/muconate lactonizing enzyme family protein [Chloroflexota bacterium]
MKIRDVTCTVLRETPTARGYPLVRVYGEDGLIGYGEASPMHPPVTQAIVEHQLKPLLVGKSALDIEALWETMYVTTYKTRGQGTSIAISGVDQALHDLAGKALGVPVYQLLGGMYRDKVRVYASYMSRDLSDQDYARNAAQAMQGGFSGVKIKIGDRYGFDSKDVAEDESLVAAVREAIGPRAELLVDANSGYSVHTAIKVGRMLERYGTFHYEEPIPYTDLDGLAQVAAALDIPVAIGEQQHTRYDFKDILLKNAGDILQPDVTKCGGLSEGKKIAVLADAFGKYVTTHTTTVGVGLAAHLHFWASTPACRYAQEFNVVASRSRSSILKTPLLPKDGYLQVPTRPGLGIELDDDAIARLTPAG